MLRPVVAVVVLALGVVTPVAVAADAGSLAVSGQAQSSATSAFVLHHGVKYELVVTGTVRQSFEQDSSSYDAFYCFQSTSNQCTTPFPSGTELGFALKTGSQDPGQTKDFHAFSDESGGARPKYDGGHSYSFHFTPAVDGKLFLRAWPSQSPDDGVSRSGGFSVSVKAAGGGVVDCPQGNEDTEALGVCDYLVKWKFTQSGGRPKGGPQDLTRIETKGSGQVRFDRKLKTGETQTGLPDGFARFTTTFEANGDVNQGNPTHSTLSFRLSVARVRYTRTERRLDIDMTVERVTGKAHSFCRRGATGILRVIQRGGKDNDEISFTLVNGSRDAECLRFASSGPGVNVTIDRPEKV